MNQQNNHLHYILQIADNALIMGQRLAEWCGHGPILEQDIALTNISLDHFGQARMLLQYAAELQGEGKTEDDLAFLRDVYDFKNVLLVEQPNGDFAKTVLRQFFYDTYNFYFYQKLTQSSDKKLAAIAEKSLKEVTYHLRWSSDWVVRLGDGTEESHERLKNALDELWMYTGELTEMNEVDLEMCKNKVGVDLIWVKENFDKKIKEVFELAFLEIPTNNWMQKGGKTGQHSEHLGFLLAEMQFLQRAYPGAEW